MSTSKRPCSVCRTASCHHPCTLVQRLKSVGIIFGFFVFCFKPSHFVCLHCLASMLTKTLSQKLFKEVGRRSRIFRPSRAVVSVPHSLLAVIISWIFWCLFFFQLWTAFSQCPIFFIFCSNFFFYYICLPCITCHLSRHKWNSPVEVLWRWLEFKFIT